MVGGKKQQSGNNFFRQQKLCEVFRMHVSNK